MRSRIPQALCHTLLLLAVARAQAAEPPGVPLDPPVPLPDGAEFKTWLPATTFTRTYHVDQRHPKASDQNPGSAELPFLTIGRAAEVLQPGERVIVAGGVYRTGICMRANKARNVLGRLATAKRNRIANNIVWDCGKPIAIADPGNACDANVFASSQAPFDLASWREKTGWDKTSAAVVMQASFDPQTLALSFRADGPMPRFEAMPGIGVDFFGQAFGDKRVMAGPFATEPSDPANLLPLRDR